MKLTKAIIKRIRTQLDSGAATLPELSIRYGVGQPHIYRIALGEIWKDVEPVKCVKWTGQRGRRKGSKDPSRWVLTPEQADRIRAEYKLNRWSMKALAHQYGVSQRTIGRAIQGGRFE